MSLDFQIIDLPANAKVDLAQWAEITIETWQFKIAQFGLISRRKHYSNPDEPTTNALIESFTFHVTQQAGGNEALVSFAFNYYIHMLDMGVGKGVPFEQRDNSKRKRYKVYSKPLYSQIYRLTELLAEQYAAHGAAIIANEFQHGSSEPTRFDVK